MALKPEVCMDYSSPVIEGKYIDLNFEGGIKVSGKIITGKRDLQGKVLLISFSDCNVTYKDEILFRPEWGVYDMAVGEKVVSVFAGPASDESFDDLHSVSKVKTKKIRYSNKERELHKLYKKVRNIRENKKSKFEDLEKIFFEIKSKYRNEWLILLEMYELTYNSKTDLSSELYENLVRLSKKAEYKELINNGLKLIKN